MISFAAGPQLKSVEDAGKIDSIEYCSSCLSDSTVNYDTDAFRRILHVYWNC